MFVSIDVRAYFAHFRRERSTLPEYQTVRLNADFLSTEIEAWLTRMDREIPGDENADEAPRKFNLPASV